MARVFCSGPLFNPPEKDEMRQISDILEAAGHATYLAQRDGLEELEVPPVVNGTSLDAIERTKIHHRAIFALDLFHLLDWADIVVANLNGRVPDEGTVVECALAWMKPLPLVLYKNDTRAPFDGFDNLMLTQLVMDGAVSSIAEIPAAVEEKLEDRYTYQIRQDNIKLGQSLLSAKQSEDPYREISTKVQEFKSLVASH